MEVFLVLFFVVVMGYVIFSDFGVTKRKKKMATKRKFNSSQRAYSIRGATTKKKLKKQKGSSAHGGGSGKSWYEILHCRYPLTPNGMCHDLHSQLKVSP